MKDHDQFLDKADENNNIRPGWNDPGSGLNYNGLVGIYGPNILDLLKKGNSVVKGVGDQLSIWRGVSGVG